MTRRLCLSRWSLVSLPEGGRQVIHPLLSHVEATGVPVTLSMYYPRPAADGAPDGPWVLIIAQAPDGFDLDAEIESIAGIRPLPAKRLDSPFSQPERQAIAKILREEELPETALGDNLLQTAESLVRNWEPAFKGFGPGVISAAAEFGRG